MLDTILKIGKTLRESGKLRHHRYVKAAPKVDKKTDVIYVVLPVREDFTFDFDNLISDFHDENKIENFYYLAYKSSDADTLVKYVWGDISYGVDKKGKEMGYYRMENPAVSNAFGLSSFVRGIEDAKTFNGTAIEKFRQSFGENRERIESLLQEFGKERYCYLHFDFQGRSWYQFEDEMQAVNKKFLREFIGEKQNNSIVLRKSLYKTLASPEKNLPFPDFSASGIYKTRTFQSEDEVLDLIYAINYSTRAVISERDIKIIILPKGAQVKAAHIEQFFERRKFADAPIAEDILAKQSEAENEQSIDDLFAPVTDESVPHEIVRFDFVFSKAGGMTSPDVDMIELSGIERSFLAELAERAEKIRFEVEQARERIFGKNEKIKPLSIKMSFLAILGDVTKDKKKYQSHLLKVLPQIYSGTYYKDAILLPAFIEKTEYNIRNEKPDFNLLKFNYEFLVRLRNNNGDKEMEDMKNSRSYAAGRLLGQLAQPVAWEIKSFEKNYVGLLNRRISDKQGLVAFANFINQKLAIHERAYPSLKEKYIELADILSNLENKQYHREYCAFGFFEGYFAKFEKPAKTATEGENND